MRRPELSAAESDRAANAASKQAEARAARIRAQAAQLKAIQAERRALVAKAASARAKALWGREKSQQEQEQLQERREHGLDVGRGSTSIRHARGLDQVQHCLEREADQARQQAHAERQAARSLRALQVDAQRVGNLIDDTLDAGEARRRTALAHARQRDRSTRVVEELELRFAWCRCVGTRAREAGGTWREQHSALSGLYAMLGQVDRDPTAVLQGAQGVPNQVAVDAEYWRFICAGLSLKYDLPTPEGVEQHHAVVCGGTPAGTDRGSVADWERVRRELEASATGEEGAVRARHTRIGLLGDRTTCVRESDHSDGDSSADSTDDIHLSWSGAWTTSLSNPEDEYRPHFEAQPTKAIKTPDPKGDGRRIKRTTVSLSAMPEIDSAAVQRACVAAIGLGVSSAELMNDQARLMATRKQAQEYHPRLVAAQKAARTAQRRKLEAARRLQHARTQLKAATASRRGTQK